MWPDADRLKLRRWCHLECFVALGEDYPRLLAARPDMPSRPEPGRIIEGPGSDPDQLHRSSRAGNP